MIDALCQRYGCLPSALIMEDTSILYRLALIAEGSEEQSDALNGAGGMEAQLANMSMKVPGSIG